MTDLREAIKGELGTKGVEAVSFIYRNLQEAGWKRLGCLADFESKCRDLGFTVCEGRNERNQRRVEVRA